MNARTELGKIEKAVFGMGGYQDVQFGLWLTISGKDRGVQHGIPGGWSFPPDEHAKWTLEEQTENYGQMARKICALLKEAKVDSVDKLVGIPVECSFNGMQLESMRVLTEVL